MVEGRKPNRRRAPLPAILLVSPSSCWAPRRSRRRLPCRRIPASAPRAARRHGGRVSPRPSTRSGQLVRPIELEEASLLLAEARDVVEHLDPASRAAVAPAVEAFAKGLSGRLPTTQVDALSVAARQALSGRTGIVEDTTPPAPPSVARGKALFLDNCARCHGDTGAGDGPDAAALDHRPAQFNDPAFMRGETPRDFFHVITLGRRRAGMPEWGDALSLQDRWDVVAYVWTLAQPTAAIPEGQGICVAQCAGCHAATGDGTGQFAAGLTAPVPDLHGHRPARRPHRRRDRGDRHRRRAGTAMPAFGAVARRGSGRRGDRVRALLGLGGPVDQGGSAAGRRRAPIPMRRPPSPGRASSSIRAVAACRAGDADASALATDAYIRFEPLEKRDRRPRRRRRSARRGGVRPVRDALRTPAPRSRSRPPRWRWTTVSTARRRCSPRAVDGPASRSRSRSSCAKDSRSSSSSGRCSPTCDAGGHLTCCAGSGAASRRASPASRHGVRC